MGSADFSYNLTTIDSSSGSAVEYDTFEFYFKDSANRDAFAAEPWNYAPKYGGF